jgi:hypothetical protein
MTPSWVSSSIRRDLAYSEDALLILGAAAGAEAGGMLATPFTASTEALNDGRRAVPITEIGHRPRTY